MFSFSTPRNLKIQSSKLIPQGLISHLRKTIGGIIIAIMNKVKINLRKMLKTSLLMTKGNILRITKTIDLSVLL